ncbi:MAG: deoxyribodipyrimidine photo-lyase, partial [Hyphomicrobiales bacterium]
MADKPVIVWFRDDFRLADHPALHAGVSSGRPVLCLYIHDEERAGPRRPGGAARWWLHGALDSLDAALRKYGARLALLRGSQEEILEVLAVNLEAAAVYWNRRYDKAGRDIDARLKKSLGSHGVTAKSFNGALLHEPWTIENKAGGAVRVFTSYWKQACRIGDPPLPLPKPEAIRSFPWPGELAARVVSLDALDLKPSAGPDWTQGLAETWIPGEDEALRRLDRFVAGALRGYATRRDRPDAVTTSRLSPSLCFGHISPRQIWHRAKLAVGAGQTDATGRDLDKFLSELGWREFSYHLLYHHPDLGARNLNSRFDAMPWRGDPAALEAWRRGRTGYPLVDAGMRELWASGWMHNRVRMVVASFLIKHLLIDWREGEAWFWDTLVDADPANNAASWQWVAGSGADAAPYFRVFNPVLQGEKHDPEASYVRRWVPELARLPLSHIHKPWQAPANMLRDAGVRLGETYPFPIVDHHQARERAL